MPRNFYIQEKHDPILKELWAAGMPREEIQKEMGFSKSTIDRNAQRLKLVTPRKKKQYNEPKPVSAIGDESPIEMAYKMLPTLREKQGAFYLQGRPARLDQVMRATNKKLIKRGSPQITVNPRWVV